MFSLIGCFMASLSQNQKSIIKVIFIVKGQGGRIKSASSKNMGLAYLIEKTTKAPSSAMQVEQHKMKDKFLGNRQKDNWKISILPGKLIFSCSYACSQATWILVT